MSERPERVWYFYVDDMMVCAEKVLAYCANLDQQAFVATPLVYDATLRNLEIIGEAAGSLAHAGGYPKPTDPRLSWHR